MIGRIAVAIATMAIIGIASLDICSAGQLRVEPVLLEMNAPTASGSLNLRNQEAHEVNVQTRVLRWSQIDGKEILEPTTDVVASPPFVKLAPNADYLVRVVRVAKRPVSAEESYRVIVDQLPDQGSRQNRAVNLLIRQSIPVFFRSVQLSGSAVRWTYTIDQNKLLLFAHNGGDERVRIASLRAKESSGVTVSFGNGLVGYVLGRSTMSFAGPSLPAGFAAGGTISIAAETDKGPIGAVANARDRR